MKKISASEGMYLTQKNIENEGGRVFALTLYLADNDSEDNWREATQVEYYAWQKAQEEETENALRENENVRTEDENVRTESDESPKGE